ncbi:MAG TPA: hypothetical protein DEQ34_00350 [Balneolaceae bacterium]|nr:hypothetical protein [Balneolaceae bacterium]|tara:strand:+ start:40960 stop:42375 length:1416 start_codon:yes stop_codon:yes gene_type:complete
MTSFKKSVLSNHILIALFLLAGFGFSCRSTEMVEAESIPKPALKEETELNGLEALVENSEVFKKTITGFELFDPETEEVLYAVNEDKYMNPASNTKLFTFYAGKKLLGERIPAMKYVIKGDSLIFWGTGDPSFLHPDIGTMDVFNFLSEFDGDLFFSDSNYEDDHLGPGWSWADYNSYYSAEKSPMPIYGNIARMTIEHVESYKLAEDENGYKIRPKYLKKFIREDGLSEEGRFVLQREREGNYFTYEFTSDTTVYETDKPFHYTPELFVELLSDTLKKPVLYMPDVKLPESAETLYSIEADSLYKQLLQPSDNMVAEHILLMISSTIDGRLNSRKAIEFAKKELLTDLPDDANWRDGSGLSRYNLFTPRSMVALLDKIDDAVDDDLLFDLLPQGGKAGTIRNWYGARDGGPTYIFAKTGTLSNNHCLSGYLITRSGKKLIFSFMNNNYVISTNDVRIQMEEILWYIHENY